MDTDQQSTVSDSIARSMAEVEQAVASINSSILDIAQTTGTA